MFDEPERDMTKATATASAPQVIEISRKQLPLSCPNAGTNPAALHPRVFIPLKKAVNGSAALTAAPNIN